jgi:cytochrome c-type biogenesis protein CcmH
MTDPIDQSAASKTADPAPSRGNWWLLGFAAIALAGAMAFALTRGDTPTAAPAAVAGSGGGGAAALEAQVAADPDNADLLMQLGQLKFDAQDYAAAVDAYRRATVAAPAVAAAWSALGEAEVMASPRGAPPMPDVALAAFRRAVSLDAADPRARYFLAVKKDIDGDHEGAIADWIDLLGDTPQGAPWEPDLRRTIEQVGARHSIAVAPRIAAVRQPTIDAAELPVAARAIPGPSRDQMEAAAALPKGQQDMMVQSMVDGLESKLRANPAQPDRWIMLMRSRMTLGESAKATEALQAAIRANPGEADRLRAQARLLGVPGA